MENSIKEYLNHISAHIDTAYSPLRSLVFFYKIHIFSGFTFSSRVGKVINYVRLRFILTKFFFFTTIGGAIPHPKGL